MVPGIKVISKEAPSSMNRILSWLTKALVVTAVACSIVLLTIDSKIGIPLGLSTPVISATPLFLIGVSFLVVQTMTRPPWTDLLKNILLASAFILWGIVQLMAQNALSKRLGNVVIALYVLDLAWVILVGLNPAR
jgi:hypothetical protein